MQKNKHKKLVMDKPNFTKSAVNNRYINIKTNKMNRQILVITIWASLLFTACQSNSKTESNKIKNPAPAEAQNNTTMTDIAFTMAKNYFVKNTVTELENPRIETAEKFNETFGMATVMGKDGKPTAIDFTKQYIIAVILPETNLQTTFDSIRLKRSDKNEMVLTYKPTVGQKQSYTTRPNFAIIVDKSEIGKVILNEIK